MGVLVALASALEEHQRCGICVVRSRERWRGGRLRGGDAVCHHDVQQAACDQSLDQDMEGLREDGAQLLSLIHI